MSLETDLLGAISLAGIGITVVFVLALHFLGGREDKHQSKAKEKDKEKSVNV